MTSLAGTRIASLTLISINGFHLPTVDIFKCEQDHAMEGEHFVEWISRTFSFLRKEHDNMKLLLGTTSTQSLKTLWASAHIYVIIDNFTWHNQLTEYTKSPKRSWNKQKVIDWLEFHGVNYPDRTTKAALLEIAFQNAPEMEYVVDKTAKVYNVGIIRYGTFILGSLFSSHMYILLGLPV